jgi:hypothetical protein
MGCTYIVQTGPDLLWGPTSYPMDIGSVRMTTHLQLVPSRSRKRGAIQPLPHTPSWRSAYINKVKGNLHLQWDVSEVNSNEDIQTS